MAFAAYFETEERVGGFEAGVYGARRVRGGCERSGRRASRRSPGRTVGRRCRRRVPRKMSASAASLLGGGAVVAQRAMFGEVSCVERRERRDARQHHRGHHQRPYADERDDTEPRRPGHRTHAIAERDARDPRSRSRQQEQRRRRQRLAMETAVERVNASDIARSPRAGPPGSDRDVACRTCEPTLVLGRPKNGAREPSGERAPSLRNA